MRKISLRIFPNERGAAPPLMIGGGAFSHGLNADGTRIQKTDPVRTTNVDFPRAPRGFRLSDMP
jgi:hypothetical protein